MYLVPYSRMIGSHREVSPRPLPSGSEEPQNAAMELPMLLEPNEARTLGVLIEKEMTVPDQYPLSLNAVTAGCNQKSNRVPVISLSESEVEMQLDKLVVVGLAGRVHPASSRVERFRHNARERLDLDAAQLAILAELMMRGPQSRGELRTRAGRMTPIDSQEKLTEHLAPLIERGFVQTLAPAPGSRAERVVQRLCPDAHDLEATPAAANAPMPTPRTSFDDLEERVGRLEKQLASLAEKLGEPLEE
jgi:uncharacterized protein